MDKNDEASKIHMRWHVWIVKIQENGRYIDISQRAAARRKQINLKNNQPSRSGPGQTPTADPGSSSTGVKNELTARKARMHANRLGIRRGTDLKATRPRHLGYTVDLSNVRPRAVPSPTWWPVHHAPLCRIRSLARCFASHEQSC